MPRSPVFAGSGSESERVMRIGALRMGVGGLLLLTPGLARKLFGIPKEQDNDAVRLIARLFGIRNVVLGAWAIRAVDRGTDERRLLYEMNAVVDAVDIALLGAGAIFGKGLVQAGIMGSALGATAVLGWLDLLQELDSGDSQESVALT